MFCIYNPLLLPSCGSCRGACSCLKLLCTGCRRGKDCLSNTVLCALPSAGRRCKRPCFSFSDHKDSARLLQTPAQRVRSHAYSFGPLPFQVVTVKCPFSGAASPCLTCNCLQALFPDRSVCIFCCSCLYILCLLCGPLCGVPCSAENRIPFAAGPGHKIVRFAGPNIADRVPPPLARVLYVLRRAVSSKCNCSVSVL